MNFYVYTKVPAEKFNAKQLGEGAMWNDANLHVQDLATTGVVSNNYDALNNMRTNAVKGEKPIGPDGPMVHVISTVTFSSFAEEASLLYQLENSGFAHSTEFKTDMMSTHGHDAVIGKDYFHQASTPQGNLLASVLSEMNIRNQALQPMREAMEKTSARNMPNLAKAETIESMKMCYAHVGVRHPVLQEAIARMAAHGLDTASDAFGFQNKFEARLQELQATAPEMGYNTRLNIAVIDTARHYQLHECSSDLMQQTVYQQIGVAYRDQLQHAAELDADMRDQAFSYATQAVSEHLAQNGQYIDNHAAQGFRHRVMLTVGERVNQEGFSQEMVQRTIKEVARDMEKGVRAYNDNKAGFCFANIADRAEAMEAELHQRGENDSLDEVSHDE